MVEDDPGDFKPGGMVGVEFDFAMAVDAEEGLEAIGEFAERRKKLLLDDEVGRMLAEKLEKSGSAANFFGERVEFGVDHAGFGFAVREKGIVEEVGVLGADGEGEEIVEQAMEESLGDGDGDVGLEIACADFANFLDVIPESGNGLGFDRTSHEFADAD